MSNTETEASLAKLSHDDAKGVVYWEGRIVAATTTAGWRVSEVINAPAVVRAAREAVFSCPNDCSASDLRQEIGVRLTGV